MTLGLRQKQEAWIEDFASIEHPVERLNALIDRAKNVPALPPEMRTDRHRVDGCVSRVWLSGRLDHERRCVFAAEADSLVVQGLARLLCQLYSGHPPEEVIEEPPRLWRALRLDRQLSPTRLHGLEQIHKRIVTLATGFLTT